MADEKYQAKIDGFDLEIEHIEDSFERSIAKHEFPKRNGALLENMGLKARTVKFRCYWYEETYETHKEFIKHLDKTETFELLHPKYGLMKGEIESVTIRADDREKTAEVDLTFIEGRIGQNQAATGAKFINKGDVEWDTEDDFADGQADLIDEIEEDARITLGAEAKAIMAAVLDPMKRLQEQFSNLSAPALEYVKAAQDFIDECDDALSEIAEPADSILSIITYPSTLPGIVAGSIAQMMERVTVSLESLKSSPTRYIASLRDAYASFGEDEEMGDLVSTGFDAPKYVTIAAAQRESLEAAYVFAEDESARQVTRALEETPAFDMLGNYIKPQETQAILTVDEIEEILGGVREDTQAAVNLARSRQTLKDTAAGLVAHVNDIKLERDKIVSVETTNILPLHLVCLANGLPYNYAGRIKSINNTIKNPTFTPSGEVKIYAR